MYCLSRFVLMHKKLAASRHVLHGTMLVVRPGQKTQLSNLTGAMACHCALPGADKLMPCVGTRVSHNEFRGTL